ncbi:MAG: endo alpha-1,4 polygalactosaminidase [Coxiellaceae bacterium]|nr:endo alpha-1,4 polygalactosaminidase [Coxiellaceae bacterium]
MKLFKKFSIACALIVLSVTGTVFAAKLPSVAFYYGVNPPMDELHAFDVVVVDPKTGLDPKKFNDQNSQAYAYVSIGEWHGDKKIPNKKWIMARNRTWNSYALDQTNPAWRDYALNDIIAPLVKQGYSGLFFDTMDSYHLFAKTPEARAQQEAGMVTLIQSVKKKYPNIKIILNRGFELLPKVNKDIAGVAAESLYAGWNHAKHRYVDVPAKSREWISQQMQAVKKYGLWPIVIDYVNPADGKKVQQVADKITADGFIPWVGNGTLTNVGVGSVTVVPRTVLMLFDGKQFPDESFSDVMRFIAFPLEQMGYVPKVVDVNQVLPSYLLKGRIAGIVVWMNGRLGERTKPLNQWLSRQVSQHIPIALLGDVVYLEDSPQLAQQLGLKLRSYVSSPPFKIAKQTSLIGFESKPFLTESSLDISLAHGESQLTIEDKNEVKSEMVAYTPWGGYALSPFVVHEISEKQTYWILQPFEFLRKALQLKYIPVADLTTKNGLRMLMVHIDGDGWATKSAWYRGPIAAKSLLDKVLLKYKIPTTTSVIEGEVSPKGVYPKFSKQSMHVAREIFKLPWVEIATHTYTHPFMWRQLAHDKVGKGYNLQIPGYRYSPEREITGSMDFINRELAPKDKHCKVILWSGDTNPDQAALKVAYGDHLLNMNGGDTLITERNKTLTAIAPIGILKGKYLQIYAPNQNENVYTNDWTGPFYGYRRAIETFQLTESPHRYKPIDIYYHTYSASKKASVRALYQVYDWALSQQTNKVYSSEYIKRAMAFYHLSLAKHGDQWLIRHMGSLKELRAPQAWGYPDVNDQDVLGFDHYDQQSYIHLSDDAQAKLSFSGHKPVAPYIVSVNGSVKNFKRKANEMLFDLSANESLQLVIEGKNCKLFENDKLVVPSKANQSGRLQYAFKRRAVNALTAQCAG